jgi:hypothetical protein
MLAPLAPLRELAFTVAPMIGCPFVIPFKGACRTVPVMKPGCATAATAAKASTRPQPVSLFGSSPAKGMAVLVIA